MARSPSRLLIAIMALAFLLAWSGHGGVPSPGSPARRTAPGYPLPVRPDSTSEPQSGTFRLSIGGRRISGPGTVEPSGGPVPPPILVGLAGAGAGALLVAAGFGARRRRRPVPGTTNPSEARDVPPEAVSTTRANPLEVGAGLALPGLGRGPPPNPRTPGACTPAGAPAGARDPAISGELARRLVRLLCTLPRLGPGDVPTLEWTQAGMAIRLGVGLSAISKVLRRLESIGIVTAETEHAIGSSRRVRIYRLTPRGERLGLALRETVRGGVPAVPIGRLLP